MSREKLTYAWSRMRSDPCIGKARFPFRLRLSRLVLCKSAPPELSRRAQDERCQVERCRRYRWQKRISAQFKKCKEPS